MLKLVTFMLRMYVVKFRLTVMPRQACHVMSVCLSKVDTSEAYIGMVKTGVHRASSRYAKGVMPRWMALQIVPKKHRLAEGMQYVHDTYTGPETAKARLHACWLVVSGLCQVWAERY